jgi:hypothetical protein
MTQDGGSQRAQNLARMRSFGPARSTLRIPRCRAFQASVFVDTPKERDREDLWVTLSRQEIDDVAYSSIVPALSSEDQRLDDVLAGL